MDGGVLTPGVLLSSEKEPPATAYTTHGGAFLLFFNIDGLFEHRGYSPFCFPFHTFPAFLKTVNII